MASWLKSPHRSEIQQMWSGWWFIYGLYMDNLWIIYGYGWWLTYLGNPLKKIRLRQLGWWHSQLNGKTKNVPNHKPVMIFQVNGHILCLVVHNIIYIYIYITYGSKRCRPRKMIWICFRGPVFWTWPANLGVGSLNTEWPTLLNKGSPVSGM